MSTNDVQVAKQDCVADDNKGRFNVTKDMQFKKNEFPIEISDAMSTDVNDVQ